MLHILLFVLKIIGILLLVILGILIFVLGTVLLLPAKYEICGETEDGLTKLVFVARAHWLLHFFTAHYTYKNKESDWQVRMGWKKWNPSQEDTSLADDDGSEESDEAADKDDPKDDRKDESIESKKKPSVFEKIKCTIQNICAKIKSFWKIKETVTEFPTDDVHIEAFRIVKEEVMRLAKHWHPRRIKGHVHFGFEDPYRTGQVLAFLSILYPFYGDNLEIYPDFENCVLTGDLYIKGHIRLWHLLMAIKVVFINRKVRKTYRDYKKLKA